MQKVIISFLVITSILLLVENSAFPQTDTDKRDWSGNINLFWGGKFLNDAGWEPMDIHKAGGILLDFSHKKLPVSIAADFFYSRDDADIDVHVLGYGTVDPTVTSETTEVNLGLRKIWEMSERFHPVIGGGFAIIRADLESRVQDISYSDQGIGFGIWLEAGIYYTFTFKNHHYNIGVDARWSKAEVDIFSKSGDAGGRFIGAVLGYHW